MKQLKINIDNQEYMYEKGTSLLEISFDFQNKFSFPILAAYINNDLEELDTTINKDCTVRFIDVLDRAGNRIYKKTLAFTLMYAMYLLFGLDGKIKISHSIDKSVLIETSVDLIEEDISKIKNKVQELIDEKLPIKKVYVKRTDAMEYFSRMKDGVKTDSLKYNTNTFVNLYKLGDIYNYFFSIMPINISCLTKFDLTYIDCNHFVMQFPVVQLDGDIPKYIARDKVMDVFKEYDDYLKKINIFSSADVNKLVSKREIAGIIKLDEVIANNKLLTIAEKIAHRKNEIKIVLIAGPSSSGKTTTSRKLSMFLKSFGMNPKPLSIDDYFKSRKETPKDANGNYDFESINAIRIEEFNADLNDILLGKEVKIPTFNFVIGEPEYKGKTLKLEENDILIVEGLHAINDELTKTIASDKKYKIYVSELTSLNIDDENFVSTSDVRLLRRIVRDARTRGYTAETTISSWDRVREGEEKYIFPYQNDVDMVYNTALVYEIGVLKLYATPLLYDIKTTSPYYEEAKRLLNFLRMFLAIPSDMIPTDSIFREFIGNSFFE